MMKMFRIYSSDIMAATNSTWLLTFLMWLLWLGHCIFMLFNFHFILDSAVRTKHLHRHLHLEIPAKDSQVTQLTRNLTITGFLSRAWINSPPLWKEWPYGNNPWGCGTSLLRPLSASVTGNRAPRCGHGFQFLRVIQSSWPHDWLYLKIACVSGYVWCKKTAIFPGRFSDILYFSQKKKKKFWVHENYNSGKGHEYDPNNRLELHSNLFIIGFQPSLFDLSRV